ncbi:hypothetical protein H0H92_010342 [Tricholoma furcatifolium]|nr:hypothetical protein H0H92_010342 [Tricholoma furcatifolium]
MVLRLLPQSDTAEYRAYVETFKQNEGLVNGLWFEILNEIFQDQMKALQYFIRPEVLHEGTKENGEPYRGYSDLLVTSGVEQTWQIVYEGKAGGDGAQIPDFDEVLVQLKKYAKTMAVDHFCYLIGARGKDYMFWRYKLKKAGDGVEIECQQMYVDVAANGTLPVCWCPVNATQVDHRYRYSILDDEIRTVILLKYIKANGGGHN